MEKKKEKEIYKTNNETIYYIASRRDFLYNIILETNDIDDILDIRISIGSFVFPEVLEFIQVDKNLYKFSIFDTKEKAIPLYLLNSDIRLLIKFRSSSNYIMKIFYTVFDITEYHKENHLVELSKKFELFISKKIIFYIENN